MTTPLTLQQVFNRVVLHARAQEVKSLNYIGLCMYRAPNGNKCFTGIFIPDDKYQINFESLTIEELKIANVLEPILEDLSNLRELQKIHDKFEPECWEDEFFKFAKKFNLTIPNLVQTFISIEHQVIQ